MHKKRTAHWLNHDWGTDDALNRLADELTRIMGKPVPKTLALHAAVCIADPIRAARFLTHNTPEGAHYRDLTGNRKDATDASAK
jgi:hypothetical protein